MLLEALICVQETEVLEALWELPFLSCSPTPSHFRRWGDCCLCISCPWPLLPSSFLGLLLPIRLSFLPLTTTSSFTSFLLCPQHQFQCLSLAVRTECLTLCIHACTYGHAHLGERKSAAFGIIFVPSYCRLS